MPREKTDASTRTATKSANAKPVKEGKAKRQPSAYNLYMKEHMPEWRKEHPGSQVKEAMAAVAKMWREAPENPNRGKEPAAKKEKVKVDKENAPKKPSSKKPAAAEKSEETEEDEEEE